MAQTLSWKALLAHALIGTVLFAAANVATYYSSQYFQRERGYQDEVSGFFDRPHATAVFAGDSHVAQLDNELLADTAYNIAWGGDGLREVYAKLKYLAWRHAKIDTLYLTADPHMFGTGRLESSNRAFVNEYLLETGSRFGLEKGAASAALGLIPLFNDDFVQYLKKKIALSLKRTPPATVRDDEVAWQSLTDAQREAQARSTGEMDHAGIGRYREPFLWYERIAALARARGIHIVGVIYPSHEAYADSVSERQYAQLRQFLSSIGIDEIVDFRHAFSDPSYFADPDHVSRKGAVALLRLIGRQTGRQLLAADVDAPASIAARAAPGGNEPPTSVRRQ